MRQMLRNAPAGRVGDARTGTFIPHSLLQLSRLPNSSDQGIHFRYGRCAHLLSTTLSTRIGSIQQQQQPAIRIVAAAAAS